MEQNLELALLNKELKLANANKEKLLLLITQVNLKVMEQFLIHHLKKMHHSRLFLARLKSLNAGMKDSNKWMLAQKHRWNVQHQWHMVML